MTIFSYTHNILVLRQELSELVESLKRRLRLKHVDYVKLFSKNLVLIFHRHFANFRRSST